VKHLIESFNKYLNEGYYKINPNAPISVEEVIELWVSGHKAEDEVRVPGYHGMYSTEDLEQYREWPDDRLRNRQPSAEYQNLRSKIEKEGIIEPLVVQVYKDGKAKIGEGNHRHAIAKELGIKHLPVRFLFWQGGGE